MLKRLRPSAAHRWLKCPGYAALADDVEDQSSEEAEEGARAHEAALNIINDYEPMYDDDEMEDAVKLYVSQLPERVQVEHTIRIDSISEGMTGTIDAWSDSDGVLRIWDFKYGHRYVEVEENPQLACYAAGLIDYLKIDGLAEQDTRFEFIIVQPRAYGHDPIRTWGGKLSDLRGLFNRLRASASEALSAVPFTSAGPHCANCEAAHKCATLQFAALAFSEKQANRGLTEVQAGRELTVLSLARELIDARMEGLSAQVDQAIRNGFNIPGWQLKEGRSSQKWKIPASKVIEFGLMFGVDLSKVGVVTPKQAIKAGIPESVVNDPDVSEVIGGALKLVPFRLSSKITKELENAKET